jgi:hypothetical protein
VAAPGAAAGESVAARSPDPELLSDARMSLARMAPVRAGIALGLQRGGGNAAVARVLARDMATASAATLTGKRMDGMLTRSSFFKPYVAPKLKEGIKAEGHVHLHDAEASKEAAVRYLKTGENPATGKLFSDEEARAFEPELRGFTDAGEIHVSAARADDGTIVHEAMHLFSSDAFVQAVGYHVNEGVTELMARRLASENAIVRLGMPLQHRLVFQVMSAIGSSGEKLFADAYFKNELQPIKDALDAKKGAGTWARWQAHMEAGKLDEADDVV